MVGTDDPNECWYVRNLQQEGCPYEAVTRHPDVVDRIQFSMLSIEGWTHTDPHSKIESKKYSVSPERIQLALTIFGVPLRSNDPPSERVDFKDGLHAMNVASIVAKALEEAPNRNIVQARERRRQKRLDELDG